MSIAKAIVPLNLRQCWKMVNRADTREKISIAEQWLLKASITNDEYDDLMSALAYKSRELYNPKW